MEETPSRAQATLHDYETTRGTAAALTTIRPREGSVRPPRELKQAHLDLNRLRARGRTEPLVAAPVAATGQELRAAPRCAEPTASRPRTSPPDRRTVQRFELPLPEGLDDAFMSSHSERLGSLQLAEVAPADVPGYLQETLPEDPHLQAAVASVSASLSSELESLHPASVPPPSSFTESPGRVESADSVHVLLRRERRAFPARNSVPSAQKAPSEPPFPRPPLAAREGGSGWAEVNLARARATNLPARPSFSTTLAGKPVAGRWGSWSAIPAALLGKSLAVRSQP